MPKGRYPRGGRVTDPEPPPCAWCSAASVWRSGTDPLLTTCGEHRADGRPRQQAPPNVYTRKQYNDWYRKQRPEVYREASRRYRARQRAKKTPPRGREPVEAGGPSV